MSDKTKPIMKQLAMGRGQMFSNEVHGEIARGSLFIGLSVFTGTYHKAREITTQLKSGLDIPIIWGGVHATVMPGECLETADMVCVGEGEELVVELAERLRAHRPYEDIPGLGIPGRDLAACISFIDISCLPRPDYALDGSHYIANEQEIASFDAAGNYAKIIPSGLDYYVSPTRGCPYKCTYCVNNTYAKLCQEVNKEIRSKIEDRDGLSAGKKAAIVKRFRKRPIDKVMEELIWAKNNLPIHRVMIDDDCFLAVKEEDIRIFANEYKKHVGLPFVIRGAHPQNVTEEKLRLLCEAGLIKLRVGVQTGSDRIRKLYDRTWENSAKVLKMARLINKFVKKGLLRYAIYDVIVDNPWETEQDQRETLDLALSLPKPFGLYCFSLTFYPGTDLYERAHFEKLIRGDSTDEAYWQNYFDLSPTPINQIFRLMRTIPLPSVIMRALVKKEGVAGILRRMLLHFSKRVPEIAWLFKTHLRYDVDCMIEYASTEEDKKRLAREYKEMIKQHETSRIELLLRYIVINIYVIFLAPKSASAIRK